MAKVGVILSGCGVYDGAEIHESVITLLALDRHGAEAVMCAPDVPQMHVVNHLTGDVAEGEARKAQVEALSDGVTITHKAGDEGKLFGSVGTAEIADACTAAGVEVSKSEVRLPEGPLRIAGD